MIDRRRLLPLVRAVSDGELVRLTCPRDGRARAHARSRDRLAIAAYLGSGSTFERAIARFSSAYADQNELDHQRLADAVAGGEVPALNGV